MTRPKRVPRRKGDKGEMPKVVDCNNVKVKTREKKKSIGHEVRATCNSCYGAQFVLLYLLVRG